MELTGIGSISQTANPPMPLRGLTQHFVRRVYSVVRGPVSAAHRTRLAFAGECLLGVTLVAGLTLCGIALHWNLSTATLVFLLLVVLTAVRYGFWQASFISLAAVLAQSYCFAPPVFSFYIADPQNGIAIVVFEATALLVSHISTRERSHAIEVERQRQGLGQMFAISRGMLLLDLQQSPVREMAELILKYSGTPSAAGSGVEAVAIFNEETCENGHGEFKTAGEWPWDPEQAAVRASIPTGAGESSAEGDRYKEVAGLSQRPLLVANAPIGSLLLLSSRSAVDPLTMDALASLVARLRAVVRRAKLPEPALDQPITIGDIELQAERRMVFKNGQPVHLTPKEFDILHYLMRHPGRPVTHKRLLGSVWGGVSR